MPTRPYTNHSDFFANVNEEGINRVARHLRRQRPSLFNHGSEYFVQHPEKLCEPPDVHPEVIRRQNPVVGLEPPLPLPGTDGQFGMEFFFQLTDFKVDFHPGNVINLPRELDPPLKRQHFAGMVRICAGIGCPGKATLPAVTGPRGTKDRKAKEVVARDPVGLPVSHVNCFCLDIHAVGHIERETDGGKEYFAPKLDGLEIVDLQPQGMEDGIECYVMAAVRVGLLPRLRFAIETLAIELMGFHLVLSPISGQIPHNPSISDDSVSIYLDLQSN